MFLPCLTVLTRSVYVQKSKYFIIKFRLFFNSSVQICEWAKVFRIIPELRILRLTFHRKSASKCWIREIIIASLIYLVFLRTINHLSLKLRIFSEHNASFKIRVSKVQDFGNFELRSPMYVYWLLKRNISFSFGRLF